MELNLKSRFAGRFRCMTFQKGPHEHSARCRKAKGHDGECDFKNGEPHVSDVSPDWLPILKRGLEADLASLHATIDATEHDLKLVTTELELIR